MLRRDQERIEKSEAINAKGEGNDGESLGNDGTEIGEACIESLTVDGSAVQAATRHCHRVDYSEVD